MKSDPGHPCQTKGVNLATLVASAKKVELDAQPHWHLDEVRRLRRLRLRRQRPGRPENPRNAVLYRGSQKGACFVSGSGDLTRSSWRGPRVSR